MRIGGRMMITSNMSIGEGHMGWYEAIKDAVTVADKLRDADLKQKMAAVQVECAKLAEENARLRQENLQLHERIETRENMEYRDDVYWRRVSDLVEGPFCPRCFDKDQRQARMTRSEGEFWRCTVCDLIIDKPSGRHGMPGHAE